MPYKLNKLSVLIVEDTPALKKLMISTLNALGIGTIYSAADGKQAFEIFCRQNPDLVITDWLMEPLNGLELVHQMRTSKASPNKMVPIILMTGYSAQPRIENARDQGITEFLVKPFTAAELSRKISYIIDKPRDFVETQTYIGPDRRRRKIDNYDGPLRRNEDMKS